MPIVCAPWASASGPVMKNLGYEVTGSDAKEGANIERLRAQGIST